MNTILCEASEVEIVYKKKWSRAFEFSVFDLAGNLLFDFTRKDLNLGFVLDRTWRDSVVSIVDSVGSTVAKLFLNYEPPKGLTDNLIFRGRLESTSGRLLANFEWKRSPGVSCWSATSQTGRIEIEKNDFKSIFLRKLKFTADDKVLGLFYEGSLSFFLRTSKITFLGENLTGYQKFCIFCLSGLVEAHTGYRSAIGVSR